MYLVNSEGKLIKHKKFDFVKYRHTLMSKKRPKSILANKNQDEKIYNVDKLNDLIPECEREDDEIYSNCDKLSMSSVIKSPSRISKILL